MPSHLNYYYIKVHSQGLFYKDESFKLIYHTVELS